jgi:hypothetical protein
MNPWCFNLSKKHFLQKNAIMRTDKNHKRLVHGGSSQSYISANSIFVTRDSQNWMLVCVCTASSTWFLTIKEGSNEYAFGGGAFPIHRDLELRVHQPEANQDLLAKVTFAFKEI